MNCKACGQPIPSHLLKQDSFQCPSCGRVYRRSKPAAAAPAAEKRPARREQSPRGEAAAPKWLLPAIAGLLILVLVAGGMWFLGRRGSAPRVSGTVQMEKMAYKKNSATTIEIPSQGGTDYMIATESDQFGIICAIEDKTPTSFKLVVRNMYSKSRNPKISWVLLPCKQSD
ncbi:MAG: hypothetical protein IKQ80_10960 [Clostridia bacterium]|nr:hypothetical protein [Clostridia bacterium]